MNPRSSAATAPHKLRDRLREVTYDAILNAAAKVFAEQGLHAAKMEAIAAEAGVAVGTLYNHFNDRKALVEALVAARREKLLGKLDAALAAGKGQPFGEQLRLFIGALVEHLETHRALLTILSESETAKLGVVHPRETMKSTYDRVHELVRRGLSSKALRKDDADLYPTLLMGMVKGCMLRQLHDEVPAASVEERTGQLVRFFLKGAGL